MTPPCDNPPKIRPHLQKQRGVTKGCHDTPLMPTPHNPSKHPLRDRMADDQPAPIDRPLTDDERDLLNEVMVHGIVDYIEDAATEKTITRLLFKENLRRRFSVPPLIELSAVSEFVRVVCPVCDHRHWIPADTRTSSCPGTFTIQSERNCNA
jgi:hypothetical protein